MSVGANFQSQLSLYSFQSTGQLPPGHAFIRARKERPDKPYGPSFITRLNRTNRGPGSKYLWYALAVTCVALLFYAGGALYLGHRNVFRMRVFRTEVLGALMVVVGILLTGVVAQLIYKARMESNKWRNYIRFRPEGLYTAASFNRLYMPEEENENQMKSGTYGPRAILKIPVRQGRRGKKKRGRRSISQASSVENLLDVPGTPSFPGVLDTRPVNAPPSGTQTPQHPGQLSMAATQEHSRTFQGMQQYAATGGPPYDEHDARRMRADSQGSMGGPYPGQHMAYGRQTPVRFQGAPGQHVLQTYSMQGHQEMSQVYSSPGQRMPPIMQQKSTGFTPSHEMRLPESSSSGLPHHGDSQGRLAESRGPTPRRPSQGPPPPPNFEMQAAPGSQRSSGLHTPPVDGRSTPYADSYIESPTVMPVMRPAGSRTPTRAVLNIQQTRPGVSEPEM